MLLTRHPQNPLLTKNPHHPWEAGSVFNPTVWREPDGRFGMLYRATNGVDSGTTGGYVSTLGLAWSTDGVTWDREPEPFISPDQSYEASLGCEDPRLTRIAGVNYIFYSAVAQLGSQDLVRVALATTKDFLTVTKYGVIGPDQYSKAGALFPQSVGDHYLLLWADQSAPGRSRIILSQFDSLVQLRHAKSADWTKAKIDREHLQLPVSGLFTEQEVGAVPIKTAAGWLLIYAGFSLEPRWTICAALLDVDNPRHILGYTKDPILLPETDLERDGVVNNVCFPEGAVIVEDELYVYYGSGDQGVCLATCKLDDLLAALRSHS